MLKIDASIGRVDYVLPKKERPNLSVLSPHGAKSQSVFCHYAVVPELYIDHTLDHSVFQQVKFVVRNESANQGLRSPFLSVSRGGGCCSARIK